MNDQRPVETAAADRFEHQPETRGLDLYAADPWLEPLLGLYLDPAEHAHLAPRLHRLGRLVTSELEDLAREADHQPPELAPRNRLGDGEQRVLNSRAYREMERLAFGEFEMAAQSHRPALGWPRPVSHAAKYTFQLLFAQGEFGLLCPVSMTDSLTRTIRRHASPELLGRYLPRLLAGELDRLWQGAMFMTELQAGSDIGATETRAVRDGAGWRLYGDKWFCSNVDAGLALVLARPEGAPAGLAGVSLFLLPRWREDGSANAYRIVRLKDKLGTRAMPSGEIVLEGAEAHLIGELGPALEGRGFQLIAEMVNQSRLSNGVRAAGLMRRAVHEAVTVALGRRAFARRVLDFPLAHRQLAKMIVPAEQALSIALFTADCLAKADAGDAHAAKLRRILTPLVKLRACRDARRVTGDAMEMRGGSGYIEEWIEPRLMREAHLGSIWEGTSNIIALDVVRAAGREGADAALVATLRPLLAAAPDDLREPLAERLDAALALLARVAAARGHDDRLARQAATALYNATTAVLMVEEARRLGATAAGEPPGSLDLARLDLARLVVAHRLAPRDPLAEPSPALEAASARVVAQWVGARKGH
jgi:acyl-CoA dehydrogenase